MVSISIAKSDEINLRFQIAKIRYADLLSTSSRPKSKVLETRQNKWRKEVNIEIVQGILEYRWRSALCKLLQQREAAQVLDRAELKIAEVFSKRAITLRNSLMKNRLGPLGLRALNRRLREF